MRIRIIRTPPVDKVHGIIVGRVMEVEHPDSRRGRGVWVKGDRGETVLLRWYVYEKTEEAIN